MKRSEKEKSTKIQNGKKDLSVHQQLQSLNEKGALFPIVGIGASAGGLDAIKGLLSHLSCDTGMAFVIIQHLDPTHESKLSELLARVTQMPVVQITDGVEILANHIYVVAPNGDISIENKILRIVPWGNTRRLHMPIDHFFRSLTKNRESQAVGIILSGTGSDGSLGLMDIKENGGITFAQEEKTAQFAGMPQSAIATGDVDFILSVENIAQELNRVASHPYIRRSREEERSTSVPLEIKPDMVGIIFRLLKNATGTDFNHYKSSTVYRRISRRMVLQKKEKLEEYIDYIKKNPQELSALYHDLLIKVTSFFRDPETFEALKKDIVPKILEHHAEGNPIRIWVPACATGEEVYSLAICFLECLGDQADNRLIRIFATDIDDLALQKARAGFYIGNIIQDVSEERLRRFFTKHDHNYRINKSIREMCTFARHDLCKDPPFSNLDLISCRNVMIYFDSSLQKRIIPIFHYALNPKGFLTLGTSESIGTFSDLFNLENKASKIYTKKSNIASKPVDFLLHKPYFDETKKINLKVEDDPLLKEADVYKEADRVLLRQYAPASVLVNEQMEILQFRGDTSHYLLPAPGKASFNLLKMARESLPFEIKAAIDQAKKEGISICRENIKHKYDEKILYVTLKVIPLKMYPALNNFLILFEESLFPSADSKVQTKEDAENAEKNQLKQELEETKQYVQSIIENQEASSEELKSANEEILSSNEELQSSNEELETAREELQSSNEELSTMNEELHKRNIELSQANNDLNNLFSSANLPIIMIERDLRIRRITKMAERVLNILPTDIGRSLEDLKLNIHIPQLETLLLGVIETGIVKEWEVQDKLGQWYSFQLRPYRTAEGNVEGAVLFLINIDSIKGVESLTRSLEEIKIAKNYSEGIVQTVREPLLILDHYLSVISANPSFYRTFQTSREQTEGRSIYNLGNGHWDIPKMRELLDYVFLKNTDYDDFEIENDFLHIGHRIMRINARRIALDGTGTETILLSIEDVTLSRQSEEKIKHSLNEKEVLLKEIHHRVKNNLQIISSLLKLKDDAIVDKGALKFIKESQNRIQALALVHEKLYSSGNLSLINMEDYIKSLTEQLLRSSSSSGLDIELKIEAKGVFLEVDMAIPCGLILHELISNIFKHAFPGRKNGHVLISLGEKLDNHLNLVVEDNGRGIPDGFDISKTTSMGLSLVQQLVDQIEGQLDLKYSSSGTKFVISFPSIREKE